KRRHKAAAPVPTANEPRQLAKLAQRYGTLRLLSYGVVDPALNGLCVQSIVVVVSTAVLSTVADVRGEQPRFGPVSARVFQKDAAARVAGADIAGDPPQGPSSVDDAPQRRSANAPLPIPRRRIRRSVPFPRRGGAVPDDRR